MSVLRWWSDSVKHLFATVTIEHGQDNWVQSALINSRHKKCEQVLLITSDFIVTDTRFIRKVARNSNHTIVIPVFKGIRNEFSNLDNVDVEDLPKDFQDERTTINNVYFPIFIDLTSKKSTLLTFDGEKLPVSYARSGKPMEVLKYSSQAHDVQIYADYSDYYGLYVKADMTKHAKTRLLQYSLADLTSRGYPLPISSKTIRPVITKSDKWGFEQIYVINLERRSERLMRLKRIFEILGVDFTPIRAVDGMTLDNEPEMKVIEQLPEYLDPFLNRSMKTGEIGCFLSHYRIWKDIVKNNYKKAMIFEDDLRFTSFGLERIKETFEDLDNSKMPWDLIYLGRKKIVDTEEFLISNHRHLSTVEYSYWTIGYALSQEGAKKLLTAEPLSKLVPVDEFLPIMGDKHPNKKWSSYFTPRNVSMFTIFPNVVEPQKYPSDDYGYFSDTEDSMIAMIAQPNQQLLKDEL